MSIALLGFRHVAQFPEALVVYVTPRKIKKSARFKKILQRTKKCDIMKDNDAKSFIKEKPVRHKALRMKALQPPIIFSVKATSPTRTSTLLPKSTKNTTSPL